MTALKLLGLVNEIYRKLHRHKWKPTMKLKFLPIIVERRCEGCKQYQFTRPFLKQDEWINGRYEGSSQ